MSDNLCGPSTALKSFSEHVNRDRSVHQDRAAGRAGPSNFRSANGVSNEAEARAFAAGGAAFQADPMMGPDMNMHAMQPHMPPAFQQMGPHAQHPQAARFGPHAQTNTHANWAAEFAAGGAGAPSAAGLATAPGAPPRSAYAPQQPLQAVNRLQHFSSGMMGQSPAYLSNYNQPQFASQPFAYGQQNAFTPSATTTMPHFPGHVALQEQQQQSSAPSGVAGLTEAELEARFAAVESNDDFQSEMDSWMARHGPTAEEQTAAANEAQDVDAILENLADELDAQRLAESEGIEGEAIPPTAEDLAAAEQEQAQQDLARDQDDLARTAGQIVDTLGGNTRFQESSFLRLMRRIHTREVTVHGDNLVDGQTGEPIEPASTSPTATSPNQEPGPSSMDGGMDTADEGAHHPGPVVDQDQTDQDSQDRVKLDRDARIHDVESALAAVERYHALEVARTQLQLLADSPAMPTAERHLLLMLADHMLNEQEQARDEFEEANRRQSQEAYVQPLRQRSLNTRQRQRQQQPEQQQQQQHHVRNPYYLLPHQMEELQRQQLLMLREYQQQQQQIHHNHQNQHVPATKRTNTVNDSDTSSHSSNSAPVSDDDAQSIASSATAIEEPLPAAPMPAAAPVPAMVPAPIAPLEQQPQADEHEPMDEN